MNGRLLIPDVLFYQIQQSARHDLPNEACGIALGRDGVVSEVRQVDNVSDAPTRRYRMDIDQQLAVYRHADQEGLDPLMVWHSHTRFGSSAHPSANDIANARDEQILHLILVCFTGAIQQYKLWAIRDGQPTEAHLEITP